MARGSPRQCRAGRARSRGSASWSWSGQFRCRTWDSGAARRAVLVIRQVEAEGKERESMENVMPALVAGMTIELSSESCAGGELRGGGPFAGPNFRAVGLHARDLEAAVGADHGDAVALDCDDLAHLAGDALRVLGRQWFGVEDFHGLAVER